MVDDVPAEEEIVDDIQEPELEDSPEESDDIGEFELEEVSESTEESPSEDQMMDAALGMMTGQPVDVTPISPPGMPPMGPPPTRIALRDAGKG